MPSSDKNFTGDARWALAMRVVGSPQFSKAVQLRDLLLYLAKKAITSGAEVTEQEIGSIVLGRRPDYDPQEDNIVRVQIRRLRQKLEDYFTTDGSGEPTVITIPKGSHAVRFEPRPDGAAARAGSAGPGTSSARDWAVKGIVIAAVLAGAFLLGRFSTPSQARTAGGPPTSDRLWSRVFVPGEPTTIVLADSSIVILENVLQRTFSLNEYIDRSYRETLDKVPDPALRDALRMISSRQYTSLADATVSSELTSLGRRMGARVAVRYARHMNIRDFNAGNFILIGSRHSVPWVELFEPNLNFLFEPVGNEQRFGFRNKRPLAGEPAVFASASRAAGSQESYATISLLPNLTRTGTVLTLAGITMEATEAAGEFAIGKEFAQALAQGLGPSAQKQPFFEVLLKATSMAGAPHKVDVLAWRRPAL